MSSDIDTARALLTHALFMLNELPTSKHVGSAIVHAIAASVVLGHDDDSSAEALELAKKVRA